MEQMKIIQINYGINKKLQIKIVWDGNWQWDFFIYINTLKALEINIKKRNLSTYFLVEE